MTEGSATLRTAQVAGRLRLGVALGPARPARREITVRVLNPRPEWRNHLPVFARREAMFYRVYSAAVSQARVAGAFDYAHDGWRNANLASGLTMAIEPDGVAVVSDRRKFSYCVRYGPFRAARGGTHRFDLAYTSVEGRINVGILSGGDRRWVAATVTALDEGRDQHLEMTVDLPRDEDCSVVVFNDHPDGDQVSRFTIRGLRGSCEPPRMASLEGRRRARPLSKIRAAAYTSVGWARSLRKRVSGGAWKRAAADRAADLIVRLVGDAVRYRIARSAPEYRNLEQALKESDEQVRNLAPLVDLAEVHRFLRDRRPDNLHVNGCGDFQLMAREHWEELRGYPEFETFSMNIDGLFGYIAHAAAIHEEMLPMAIYHLEHEVGSGWSPEGEAVLRRRIAERGITWVDASTVYVWAAYMRWLGRPMIFNGSAWGLADASLVERAVVAGNSLP